MAKNEDTEIVIPINPEGVPPQLQHQPNIYKPSDIKRYGTERFLAQVAPKEPIHPNFAFTPEEQQRMDALLAENEPT